LKKFGIIGVILLAVVVLVGFALMKGSDKGKANAETVTINNAETEECGDSCENCPESLEGECSGHEESEAHIKDKDCDSHTPEHEVGSKECKELQEAGKCPGKCPHSEQSQQPSKDKI
jgi:hypothetical protein